MDRAKKIQKKPHAKPVASKAKDPVHDKPANAHKLDIDIALLSTAVKYIRQAHQSAAKEAKDLFAMAKNPFLYLTVLVNEMPTEVRERPAAIALPHSIYGAEFNTRCFFITTNQFKKTNKAALQALGPNWKCVSYDQFSKKYHQYKDRLAILKDNELFFCDQRIQSILRKHCGVHFFRQKKYPYGIDFSELVEAQTERIDEDKLKEVMQNAVERHTYFSQGNGPEYGVKVARMDGIGDHQILKNCKAALKGLLEVLIGRGLKLSNLRRVSIRGETGETFPLYSHLTPAEKTAMRKAAGIEE